MEARAPRIMFIAGENSGDQHAGRVIRELRTLLPDATYFGFGGERKVHRPMRIKAHRVEHGRVERIADRHLQCAVGHLRRQHGILESDFG